MCPQTRKQAFNEVNNQVFFRMASWKARVLSQVGRTILIRSVVIVLPIYQMSYLLLPKGWCESIDKCTKDFCVDLAMTDEDTLLQKAWD